MLLGRYKKYLTFHRMNINMLEQSNILMRRTIMSKSKNLAIVGNQCVSCGVCIKVCPLSAISIYKGMYAVVDEKKCVGCGKCATACPASVIEVVERQGVKA